MDFYCCLQFIFDADRYLVKRPMIGQSKIYWTAYQTLLIFLRISVMPVSFASANRVNQSNLFGRNVDKAESSLSYFP